MGLDNTSMRVSFVRRTLLDDTLQSDTPLPRRALRVRVLEAVFQLDRYQSGIDHSLIDLESGMVNWYLRIPLSSLILLSSDGAVFSRDPCIGLLQCSGKRKNMAGNGRKQPEKVGYGKKRDGI